MDRQPTNKGSRQTLLPKASTATIREDILLQETPPGSPGPREWDSPGQDSYLSDPTASYTLEYKGHTVQIDPTDWRHSTTLRLQIMLGFMLFTLIGLADQTTGTLMPILVKEFHTTQTKISTVFMLGFCGFTFAAFINEYLHVKFGRRGVLVMGVSMIFTTYLVNALHKNLTIFIGMYFCAGLGGGLSSSAVNVFLSSITDHNELMGLLHGFYGLGSILCPPLASWVAENWGFRTYYLFHCGLTMSLCVAMAVIFKHETKWKYAYLINMDSVDEDENSEGGAKTSGGAWEMLKNKLILAFCAYLFFYVGGELSIGSWLLTYLRDLKGLGQLESSIICSWFWFGLTFGRMVLGFTTKKFSSEYKANTCYGWLSWVSFTAYAAFSWWYSGEHYALLCKPLVFVMGVFIGPLYPTASVVLLKLLPLHQHVSGVGIASSIGGSGSAIVPFIVGSLSRWVGFQWLLAIVDVVIFAYCAVWAAVPTLAGTGGEW